MEKTIGLSDVENLCNAIVDYNITIETTSGVIETDKYNLVEFIAGESGMVANNICEKTQKEGSIILGYNPEGNTKIQANKLNKQCKTTVIPYSTIKSFRIKSKRDFLLNQVPIKKMQGQRDRLDDLEKKVEAMQPKLFKGSDRKNGKLDIPTNDGTMVIFWEEIKQNFSTGGDGVSAQINLNTIMSEIHSVHASAMASDGITWDHPHFQCSIINGGKTVQIMASKGGVHTLHLLVIGQK